MTDRLSRAVDDASDVVPSAEDLPPREAPTAADALVSAAVALVTDEPVGLVSGRPWIDRYRLYLLVADMIAIAAACIGSYWLRFSSPAPTADYIGYAVVLCLGWLVALQNSGGYSVRHLSAGPTESKAVLRASGIAVSVLAVFSYATRTEVARGFVVQVIPIGIVLLFLGRAVVRRSVVRHRRAGRWIHRILAVGTAESVDHLLDAVARAPQSGLVVVGACVEDAPVGSELRPGVPVVAGVTQAAQAAAEIDADVVAVAGSGLGPRGVRELGWALEYTGRDLVLAPALTEIAGPRVHVSPVEGLPLVWVEQPHLGRVPQLIKRLMDIAGALVLGALALPVICVAAVLIKLDSRGPVFYRQRRLSIGGHEFLILKLRTMFADAEHRRADILALNEQDGAGVLFKIRRDPRITRVGRRLRQFSIDELPQLFHVLTGQMSLVGPRPLAAADSTYEGHARRRLLVRPGLTGLWQVSGRSDLSWDDAVRLDLFYVENWSIGGDLAILVRTVRAVLRRDGAY